MDETNTGSSSTLAAVSAGFETITSKEYGRAFEAGVIKSIFDILSVGSDVEKLSDTAPVLERLENGECEELRMEDPAVDASAADPKLPDSLIDNNVAGNPPDSAMVDTEEASMLCTEEATEGELPKELVVDTNLGSGREPTEFPLEEGVHVLPKRVPNLPEIDEAINLETGGVDDARVDLDLPGTCADLSDAETSSGSAAGLEHLHIEEPVEHDPKLAAKISNADSARPDSALDDTSAGSPSTVAVVSERVETKTPEEPESAFEAEATKSILGLLSGDSDVDNPSDTAPVLERLENGECEKPETENVADEAPISNLKVPDTVIDRDDAGIPSDTIPVRDRLENGECEGTTVEDPAVETSISDLNLPDSSIDRDDDRSPSGKVKELERLENGECEEVKMKEPADDAQFSNFNARDSSIDRDGAGSLSNTVPVLERLENVEYEEPKMENPADEAQISNLSLPDSTIDKDSAGSLSDTVPELEHLESGEREGTKMEDPAFEASTVDLNLADSLNDDNVAANPSDLAMLDTSTLCAEEDTGLGSGRDLTTLLIEEGAHVVPTRVQEIPETDETMDLETGEMDKHKSTLEVDDAHGDLDLPGTFVDLSHAETSSGSAAVLGHLHTEEPVEHDVELAAKISSADLARPDSALDETSAGSPSTVAVVSERVETETSEEPESAFEADAKKSIIGLLSGDDDNPSDTVPVLDRLKNGECEKPETENVADEASISNLNIPDSSIEKDDAGSPLQTVAVRDSLGNGEREKPKMKEPSDDAQITGLNLPDSSIERDNAGSFSDTGPVLEHLENGECEGAKMEDPPVETSIVDRNLPDPVTDNCVAENPSDLAMIDTSMLCTKEGTEGDDLEELEVNPDQGCGGGSMQLPLENGAQILAKREQDISGNDFENNESISGSMYYSDKDEAKEEARSLDTAALFPSLEGEDEYLPSSKQLPLEIGKSVIQLQCESRAPGAPNGVCTVTVVGTAHVSKASCEEVKTLISHVKPEVVFLELCSSRTNVLLPRVLEVPTFSRMLESYKKKEMNLFGLLYSWFLAKVGEKLESAPGAEFRVAYEEALKYGASVTLGDRPIQITLKRTWGMMSTWHKIKLIFCLLTATFNLPSADEFQSLMEKMEQSDEVTLMIQELSKTFPTLSETLVAERDLYMVASLRTVARRCSSVVGVVGRGHLSGIAKHWKDDIKVEELVTIPKKNPSNRKWLWSSLALGVGGMVVGVRLLRQR